MATKPNQMSNVEARKMLEKDVAAFLKAGKKIEHVRSGVSGQVSTPSRKHLVLGQSKRTT